MRPSISVDPFTVEDFFAFTAARPDGEKWELIEGFPVCDATGTWHHQRLLGGVLGALWDTCRERPYEVLPGFAVRLSPHDVVFQIWLSDRGVVSSRQAASVMTQ